MNTPVPREGDIGDAARHTDGLPAGQAESSVNAEASVAELAAALSEARLGFEKFAHAVSHDLRAPLRHIMGFAELLKQETSTPLAGQQAEYLTAIVAAAKRLEAMMDGLLAWERVGRLEIHKAEVDLNELVQRLVMEVKSQGGERERCWKIHALPVVFADRRLLRMALANCVSNAMKFTGANPNAEIEIGCAPEHDAETVIFIRDNGAGFDPKYGDRLFGLFERLHRREEFDGVGAGLALVLRVVQRHGGRVWAEGAVGRGATFFLAIPKQKESSNGKAN